MKRTFIAAFVIIISVVFVNNRVVASEIDCITDGTDNSQIVHADHELDYHCGGALEAREQDILAGVFQTPKKSVDEMVPITPTRDG